MPKLVYLSPGELFQRTDEDEHWLYVHASGDGRFFGSGWARTADRQDAFYVSLAVNDATLERAIAAAMEWARQHDVPCIWVQLLPNGRHSFRSIAAIRAWAATRRGRKAAATLTSDGGTGKSADDR